MKNMTILVDANVILDYIASREPYYQEAYKVMELCYIKKYMDIWHFILFQSSGIHFENLYQIPQNEGYG